MLSIISAEAEKEIETAARLAEEIWHEHYDGMIGSEQVAYMLKKYQSQGAIVEQIAAGTRYWLAVKEGEAAGYCAAKPEEDRLFLSKIYVRAQERRQGVARALYEKAEALARELRLGHIYLTVNKRNEGSIAVYRAWGFTVADAVKTDIGGGFCMDDYIMEKPL